MQAKEYIIDSVICTGNNDRGNCFLRVRDKAEFIIINGAPELSSDLSVLKSESHGDYSIIAKSTETYGKIKCTVDAGKMRCDPFQQVLENTSPRRQRRG